MFGAFVLFIVVLSVLGVYFYLSNSISTASSPVFEEIYATSSDLKIKIGQIDSIIYDALYKSGVQEKAVFFSAVEPRNGGGDDWDFTELLIELSSKDFVFELNALIYSNLYDLNPDVEVEVENLSSHELICRVFVSGLNTHKVRIRYKDKLMVSSRELPKIAIIIDDLGYDLDIAKSLMKFDLPLSLSVLPLATYTSDIVEEANKQGCELLLHIPMEPKEYPRFDPGPGALLTDMNDKELRKAIDFLLKQTPGVIGVNHHMGSSFSERRDKMSVVLSELKGRNLFYVDSRTTAQTIAYDLAKEMGVPAGKKSTFLDHDLSLEALRFQVERLMGMARYSGEAIGIGHPHKETLEILKEYSRQLTSEFNVVPVSELVN